jgi:hypothetical protein
VTAFRDYFFIDDKRLESFSAQLNQLGLKSTTVRSRTSTKKGSADGSMDLGLIISALAKAGVKFAKENSESITSSDTYDPYWIEIGNFIDESMVRYNDDHPLDVSQLRHVVGRIMLMDISIIKEVLSDPVWNTMSSDDVKIVLKLIRSKIEEYIQRDLLKPSNINVDVKKIDVADLFVRTMWKLLVSGVRKLPFSMMGIMIEEETNRWFYFTVSREYLLHGYDDLTLKHGAQIPGLWSILGVIDAVPTAKAIVPLDLRKIAPSLVLVNENEEDEEWTPALIGGMDGFYNFVRQAVGRPQTFYAISPLVIYRNLEVPGDLPLTTL